MMSIDDNGLFKIFPAIETIATELEYQNQMLNKIVLTGKINALNIAENLFNFTEKTAQTFSNLQTQLIENLLEENKKELCLKASSKAQVAIDTLNRSLYERSADIQYISKDSYIKDFLNSKIQKQEIIDRLKSFAEKYSVYNEIIIFDIDGNLKANINKGNRIRYTKDDVLERLQQSDSYICEYKKTDMFIKERESLFFADKIVDDGKIVGYIVLFYKFKEEMQNIFKELVTENEIITIVDNYNNVLASSEKGIEKNFVKVVNRFDDYVIANEKFHVKVKGEGYKGFNLDNWYAITSYSRRKDINLIVSFKDENGDQRHLAKINLNNPELEKLSDNGYSILEDLSDVIINGELIAAKTKQYILIPILDNLREVSFRVVKLIELSISNLQEIINDSTLNEVESITVFIIDTIIRNLYERANNVRWFAKLPLFLEELSKDKISYHTLTKELLTINKIYPIYKEIFIYDVNGKIIATSNNQNIVGEKINHNYTNSNRDENRYFVSNFENSKFFDDRATYIFYASIFDDTKSLGGIGVVFDTDEFKNILNLFMANKRGCALIVNKNRKIISSNSDIFNVLDELQLDIELKDGFNTEIGFNDKNYKIFVKQATPYREYKDKSLYSVVMLEK